MSDAQGKLLNYINGELLTDPTRRATAGTPLFEDGWIDSLKILKLIAYVELMIGRNIPDEEIVMKNFRTVTVIVEHFAIQIMTTREISIDDPMTQLSRLHEWVSAGHETVLGPHMLALVDWVDSKSSSSRSKRERASCWFPP